MGIGLSTPHQRLYIRTLLRRADISALTVREPHMRMAEACGVKDHPAWKIGKPLDDALRELTVAQAREFTRQCMVLPPVDAGDQVPA